MASLKPALAQLASGTTLSADEAEAAFGVIMSGEATPAQIAGLLVAMRVWWETVAELTEAVRALHALLRGELGPYRDTMLLNAAAGLIAAGAASDLRLGAACAACAAAAIDGGFAATALDQLRRATA